MTKGEPMINNIKKNKNVVTKVTTLDLISLNLMEGKEDMSEWFVVYKIKNEIFTYSGTAEEVLTELERAV